MLRCVELTGLCLEYGLEGRRQSNVLKKTRDKDTLMFASSSNSGALGAVDEPPTVFRTERQRKCFPTCTKTTDTRALMLDALVKLGGVGCSL